MNDVVKILQLSGMDAIVIQKDDSSNVFITTPNSIIIGSRTVVLLVNYLVKNKMVSPKVLAGILEECHTE